MPNFTKLHLSREIFRIKLKLLNFPVDSILMLEPLYGYFLYQMDTRAFHKGRGHTPLYGHLLNMYTSLLRTVCFVPGVLDLVTVFDSILTSGQTREKLQCLYENLMSNNFCKTTYLITVRRVKKYDGSYKVQDNWQYQYS